LGNAHVWEGTPKSNGLSVVPEQASTAATPLKSTTAFSSIPLNAWVFTSVMLGESFTLARAELDLNALHEKEENKGTSR
jgi:hypothetical protein